MHELKKLNFYNFITDLIFHPSHAVPQDRKKTLSITIALSILSLGLIPLSVGISWGVGKAVTWIKKTSSATDNTTKAITQVYLKTISPKAPIRYQKEAKGAPHMVPKDKNQFLGKGANAKVFQHRNNPEQAIKVIRDAHEYEIGAMLNHPVLAKSETLFIKEYSDHRPETYKLVMEKVNGKKITSFQQSGDGIAKETAIKLIGQAKECCIYLFQSGVYWKDVNDGNIIIENKTENLRIIDFGYWGKESNAQERVKHLLLGAMELTTWIVGNSTCVKKNGVKDRQKKKEIAFPKQFFSEQIQSNQIFSICSDFSSSWMQKIAVELEKMNDNQMKGLLSSYFDNVIIQLSKQGGG